MTNKKTLEEIKWLLATQNKFHWWRVVEGAIQFGLFVSMIMIAQVLIELIRKI